MWSDEIKLFTLECDDKRGKCYPDKAMSLRVDINVSFQETRDSNLNIL